MIKANEVNAAQVAMVKNISAGGVPLPKSSNELAELVTEALLLRDHDTDERPSIDKCKIQFIKVLKQQSDDDGWLYLSIIKNVLSKRAYFKALVKSQSFRSMDAMRSITRELIEHGIVRRVGYQVMLTDAAEEYLKKLEGF